MKHNEKTLLMVLAVVVVVYLLFLSPYKSNATFDLSPGPFVPPTAEQVAAANPILANAHVAAAAPTQALVNQENALFNQTPGFQGKLVPEPVVSSAYSTNAFRDMNAAKFGSGYKTNAYVNRKSYSGKFKPPSAAQSAAAASVLAAANAPAPSPQGAPTVSKYSGKPLY
jgi:hypothetical protein